MALMAQKMTQLSPIFQAFVLPLHFYKRPTLALVFINHKSEEDFLFCENSIHCVLQWALIAAAHTPSRESGPPSSFPETHSIVASSCQSFELSLWASVLHLDLLYASVTKMCPNIITSLLSAISA